MWGVIATAVLLIGAFGAAASKDKTKENASAPASATTIASDDTNGEPDTSPETTVKKVTTTTAKKVTTTTSPPVGTRDNPVPLGLDVRAGDWNYLVIGYEADGIDGILHDINQFNDPAPPGKVTVRVRYRATYTGTGTGTPLFSITINLVGASGVTYGEASVCCTPKSDELGDQPETFNGGSIEGYIYYQVSSEDAAGQLLAFDPNVNYTDVPGGVGFFAVN